MKKKLATVCLIVTLSGGMAFADTTWTPGKMSNLGTSWLTKVRLAWDHFTRMI